jgi:hypothetical protein
MRYVMLIYQPPGYDPKALSPEQHQEIGRQYGAVSATYGVEPGLPLGHLTDAVTVRVGHDGVLDAAEGPYVSPEGAIGGYFVFDAPSKEEAVALAARVPAARMGGAVEVRPAQAYWNSVAGGRLAAARHSSTPI